MVKKLKFGFVKGTRDVNIKITGSKWCRKLHFEVRRKLKICSDYGSCLLFQCLKVPLKKTFSSKKLDKLKAPRNPCLRLIKWLELNPVYVLGPIIKISLSFSSLKNYEVI